MARERAWRLEVGAGHGLWSEGKSSRGVNGPRDRGSRGEGANRPLPAGQGRGGWAGVVRIACRVAEPDAPHGHVMAGSAGSGLRGERLGRLFLAKAPERTEVDQDVEERVVVGDGRLVAQPRPLDAELGGLAVDALGGGALGVDGLVVGGVPVELVPQPRAGRSGHRDPAAARGPLGMVDGTTLGVADERTGPDAALVLDEARAVDESALRQHGLAGLADGVALRVEAAGGHPATGHEGYRGEATGLVEEVVDVEGVEGRVEGAVARSAAEALFGRRHERLEVRHVVMVEGLGQLRQDDLGAVVQLGDDHARGVAPIELRSPRRAGWRGLDRRRVRATLAAQPAVRIARRLLRGIEAFGDVGLGVVLAYPGQDVLGVQADGVAQLLLGHRVGERTHDRVHQPLPLVVAQLPQDPAELPPARHAGLDIEAIARVRIRRHLEAEDPDQRRMLDQEVAQAAHVAQPAIDLDQVRRRVRCPRRRFRSRPWPIRRPLREVAPRQLAQQRQVSHGHRAVAHEVRQGLAGRGQLIQARPFHWHRAAHQMKQSTDEASRRTRDLDRRL